MQVRDRIKEFRRVRAADLRPNPKNWRTHPTAQRDALRGVLAEIGYADALLVRETSEGQLELIDGHLRAETTPEVLVPVLVLDVNGEEADKILLTHDPIGALADADPERLAEVASLCTFEHPQVVEMIDKLQQEHSPAVSPSEVGMDRPEVEIHDSYQVVVECNSEDEQQQVYDRMTEEGYRCRVLTL